MSCISLQRGYNLQCIGSNAGGVKAVGLAVFANGAINTRPSGGLLTALPDAITEVYRYELKNTANVWTETSSTDVNNRTMMFSGSMTAVLNTLEDEMMEELYNLSKGEVFLFIELNDTSKILLAGAKYGATSSYVTSSGGDLQTGQSATITFTTTEDFPFLTLDSTAMTAYQALIVE